MFYNGHGTVKVVVELTSGQTCYEYKYTTDSQICH